MITLGTAIGEADWGDLAMQRDAALVVERGNKKRVNLERPGTK